LPWTLAGKAAGAWR